MDIPNAGEAIYCLSVVWVEVIGKVCREARKSGVEVNDVVNTATRSLLESGVYEWINPTPDAIKFLTMD